MASRPSRGPRKLPTEILCTIFQYLDPAGLISVSQTNSHMRSIIQPDRIDFCERLLFLESQQESGTTPIYNTESNELKPAWTSPEWQSMLWACSDCLRLLPHTAFDNHRILALGYRKPIPGSPAVTKFTSWQPGANRESSTERAWRQRDRRMDEDCERAQKRYRVAITHIRSSRRSDERLVKRLEKFQGCGMAAFEDMTLEEFIHLSNDEERSILIREAHSVELVYSGYKRHQRWCNECRYQRGQLWCYPDGVAGSLKVPITRSRRVRCASRVERHFPGLATVLNIKNARGQETFAVYPLDTGDVHWWTTYMIRCCGCSRWKEARFFPTGKSCDWETSDFELHYTDLIEERGDEERAKWDWRVNWESFDNIPCYQCFVLEHGRQAFEIAVLDYLNLILDHQKAGTAAGLVWMFQGIRDDSFACPPKWRAEVYDITDPPRESCRERGSSSGVDGAVALSSYRKWIKFLERTKNAGRHRNWHGVSGPYDGMQRDYEERMVHFTRMNAIIVEVQEREMVEKLVELALNDTAGLLYVSGV